VVRGRPYASLQGWPCTLSLSDDTSKEKKQVCFHVKGMDIAGVKSGRGAVSASVDELAKAYEALLGLGFKNQQIQEAMQVKGPA
jgi:Holliday junction resolvasome RuvABC DNA-binding subunit